MKKIIFIILLAPFFLGGCRLLVPLSKEVLEVPHKIKNIPQKQSLEMQPAKYHKITITVEYEGNLYQAILSFRCEDEIVYSRRGYYRIRSMNPLRKITVKLPFNGKKAPAIKMPSCSAIDENDEINEKRKHEVQKKIEAIGLKHISTNLDTYDNEPKWFGYTDGGKRIYQSH